jgi:hypothetical protein
MTEVFKKLNYKNQEQILILSAPRSFESELREISKAAGVDSAPKKGTKYGFALCFAPMKADLLKAAKILLPSVEEDAVLWFAYPKQTSKAYKSDLNRDVCWAVLASLGIQPVRQIAIDADWSALRFKRIG